jgi:hypothetical protein
VAWAPERRRECHDGGAGEQGLSAFPLLVSDVDEEPEAVALTLDVDAVAREAGTG